MHDIPSMFGGGGPASVPSTTVPSGSAPSVATIPTPSGSATHTVDDACCGCICVGPDCQPEQMLPPKECLPGLVLEICAGDAPQAVVIGKGKNKGKVYREDPDNCGNFPEDTSGDCPTETVEVLSADGASWARDTDGTLYKRNATTGAWAIVDCGPVVESSCIKCVVVDIDDQGDATFYEHKRPAIADFRSDITDQFCTQGG